MNCLEIPHVLTHRAIMNYKCSSTLVNNVPYEFGSKYLKLWNFSLGCFNSALVKII